MARVQETLAVMVLFWGCCLRAALADRNCEAMPTLYQECFLDNDLNITLFLDSIIIDSVKKPFFNAFIFHRTDLCTIKDKLQKAIECAMSRWLACLPEHFGRFLPPLGSMGKVMEALCGDKAKINFECVTRKHSEFLDCLNKRYWHVVGTDEDMYRSVPVETVLCKTFQVPAECYRTVLSSCGCATVKPYETAYTEVAYPQGCSKFDLQMPDVRCNETNPESGQDNGGQRHLASTVSFLASSLLVFLNLFAMFF